MKKFSIAVILICGWMVLSAKNGNVVIYPAPDGEVLNEKYQLSYSIKTTIHKCVSGTAASCKNGEEVWLNGAKLAGSYLTTLTCKTK
jgi:hypothetical protein